MKSALYLITGFLGAGKTTFLQQFVRLFHGKKLAMVINEFGREDVDGQLLRELHAKLESIHSGSIFCACRLEQFEHALTGLLEDQPDVVLVETSGLSDPTNIREVLSGLSSLPVCGLSGMHLCGGCAELQQGICDRPGLS